MDLSRLTFWVLAFQCCGASLLPILFYSTYTTLWINETKFRRSECWGLVLFFYLQICLRQLCVCPHGRVHLIDCNAVADPSKIPKYFNFSSRLWQPLYVVALDRDGADICRDSSIWKSNGEAEGESKSVLRGRQRSDYWQSSVSSAGEAGDTYNCCRS